ncbi:Protein pitchfork [Amphibalanus amphitrite]|uniref:Protein pitchfork n=1 Tax=Amphibalanus amphitrite TaxID=1232801 RepID=A0A6A4WUT3_AMPAM|nr:Protein pitchfork [Amphibalanus amphitrite]
MEILRELDLYKPSNPKLVFGSTQERKLLPTLPSAAPASRLGLLLHRDSWPQLGPGRYATEQRTSFTHQLDLRPRSRRGVMFGASTEPRLLKAERRRAPSPGRYQADLWADLRPVQPPRAHSAPPSVRRAPFGRASDRFYEPRRAKDPCTPGVGAYHPEGCIIRRELRKQHSFGGKIEVVPSVIVKCVVNNSDLCNVCGERPYGDYYESGRDHLCRACYRRIRHASPRAAAEVYSRQQLAAFRKVRDCSEIHRHENTDAALQLKTPREINRLRNREAYLSLYF